MRRDRCEFNLALVSAQAVELLHFALRSAVPLLIVPDLQGTTRAEMLPTRLVWGLRATAAVSGYVVLGTGLGAVGGWLC
jgi:hypothetical protein